MVAMGIVLADEDSLGVEATGVITRVGAQVDHLKVGDRIFTLWFGLFATRKVISAKYARPLPEESQL